jgi:hypothetical protein
MVQDTTTVTETGTDTDQSVIIVTSPTDPNQTLQLDCYSEELSEFQKAFYEEAVKEHQSIKTKLQEAIGTAQNIFTGEIFSAYEILGPVPGLDEFSKPISSYNKKEPKKERSIRKRERSHQEVQAIESDEDEDTIPLSKRKAKDKRKERKFKQEKAPSITSVSNVRPTESSAIGGLVVGTEAAKRKPTAVVDLTKDDNTSDATEVSFNKLNGKTFPSLVVVARPSLRVKETFKNDRSVLDAKVKSVLMHQSVKFTEWLIQQGLVKSEQGMSFTSLCRRPSLIFNFFQLVKFTLAGILSWECIQMQQSSPTLEATSGSLNAVLRDLSLCTTVQSSRELPTHRLFF